MRLEEDGVDLLEIDGFGVIPHGFDQCAAAEVSDSSERAFRAAGMERSDMDRSDSDVPRRGATGGEHQIRLMASSVKVAWGSPTRSNWEWMNSVRWTAVSASSLAL
jgi:hypothetical protein